MRHIEGANNLHSMLQMYKACIDGPQVDVRGMAVRNVPNMAIMFDANQHMLTAFEHRNLNLAYCKREWLWYLGADKMDDSICEHAKMWAKLKQPDGSFYSNYGQYIFGKGTDKPSQFEYVVQQLKKDPHTRRASMVLLSRDHLFDENIDTVCTYAINFCIVRGYLDMTVMMRSNDVVFGFTNDAFCFSQLHEFVYAVLAKSMPGLQRGQYVHFTNSMHVYERHFGMLYQILGDPRPTKIVVPRPSAEEVVSLVRSQGKEGVGGYSTWLKTFD